MKTCILFATLALFLVGVTNAFAPRPAVARTSTLHMGFMGDPEDQPKLTRDAEPDDYFQTTTDKMSDEEKLPIAIAGIVGISLPFILGLIALYSAK
mmetsp:Transcript_6267/g.11421  ORF Transcript_6267/g.11421 Transcript_6267/m.11421 type:complete len:96 (-) Transcript_6267:107-394(-)|eukprot:CAMPEP_0202494206 /NCGR_PEP_ID=MMETSP1361-20130828/11040_1 /ASSEMBLY_ACC=CAM_ASM_000849 /TAXON_ID=210615 /ORGANISM="Staurosira complex sp., Strain CCMP2646" /LENGTH=95 /DNA_ID=CAMNT_0049124633 /DNA_START=71 /DNA_END=358 /DNA_ORIENTATION=+